MSREKYEIQVLWGRPAATVFPVNSVFVIISWKREDLKQIPGPTVTQTPRLLLDAVGTGEKISCVRD